MKKVMCFGTFDLLHLGHLNYFKQAKKFGDYLIVVIARDQTKHDKKPFFTENERLELVKSLELVDEAVLGDLKDHFKVIKERKPDLLCLGYDQQYGQKLKELGIENKIIINYEIILMLW